MHHLTYRGLAPIFIMAVTACACQETQTPPQSYFDVAEQAYRTGKYEIAHQYYAYFLKQNPDPQLARLAQRRIFSIEREIECVLGKDSGPRPAYVNREESAAHSPVPHPKIFEDMPRNVRLPL